MLPVIKNKSRIEINQHVRVFEEKNLNVFLDEEPTFLMVEQIKRSMVISNKLVYTKCLPSYLTI